MIDLTKVDEVVRDGITSGVFPGACYAVGFKGEVQVRAHGRHMYCPDSPAVEEGTMWDMASCTKVVACTTAAMLLFDEGKLKLDQRVAEVIPEFAAEGKGAITVRNLLLHNSGLPGGVNVHTKDPNWTPQRVLQAIWATPLKNPIGAKTLYSDLSMVTLAKMIEKISGMGLDELTARRVFGPLGMKSSMFNPPAELRAKCAPTEEIEPWRLRVREERGNVFKPSGERCHPDAHLYTQGEVHDPTSFMIGGVSGNAGLFSTGPDLAKFATMMLEGFKVGARGIIKSETIKQWTLRQDTSENGSSRALGWDTRSSEHSSAGQLFSKRSFGHTGFTGPTVWIDPEHDLFAALLCNRVHPTANNQKLTGLRPKFHDAVARACGIGG
jgi:CubicO group peptidase (beta-lactamase class C family)